MSCYIYICLWYLEEASVPFDKEHLKLQIEAGGGIALDTFNESLVSYLKTSLFSHPIFPLNFLILIMKASHLQFI